MKIKQLHKIFSEYPVIITDSRECREGAIFFALKGEQFDGNRFAAQALEKGCIRAVVDDPDVIRDERYILVEDTLVTLQRLAQYHRQQLDMPVLAITGTNGKTTTKELVVTVLSRKYNVTGTRGNLNNHIGLPLTLLSADRDTGVLVTEMGANHPGEIAFLCKIADPTHGIITNIGKAHLEGFGSFEKIVETKTELYGHLEKKGGVAFYHAGNPILRKEVQKVRNRISYGLEDDGPEIAFRLEEEGAHSRLIWVTPDGDRPINSRLYGSYNLENMMAAVAVGVGFGVAPDDIVEAVSQYVPRNMRSQVIRTKKGNTVILDAYNANPTSMEYAIEEFAKQGGDRKAVILGDMLELGRYAEEEHERILQLLKRKGFEKDVYLTGKHFSERAGKYGYTGLSDRQTLKDLLAKENLTGYTILIKGSRLIRLEEVLEEL